MTTEPLWTEPPRPHGPVRRALDGRLAALRAAGSDLPDDLAVVVQSLADRIDAAIAGGDKRGYVMLSAEYRAARRDLLEGVVTGDSGPDPLAAALADFRAATAGNSAEPVPSE